MGTRGLIAVMIDSEYRVAQYFQWDGYPEGQGITALEFCRAQLSTPEGREAFKAKVLAQVRWSSEEAKLRDCTFMRTKRNYSTGKDEEEAYPYAGRDNGAEILELVWTAPEGKPIYLTNNIEFAGESLFCEWGYVVDLDKESFEVYKGFNKSPVDEKERFAKAKTDEKSGGYFPIRFAAQFSLNDLPSNESFLARFKEDEDDE